MPTRVSNLGYAALGKETTKGTPAIPSVFAPIYDDSFDTKTNIDVDSPIVGQRLLGYAARQGMRSHEGTITFLGEPNTAAHLFNMLLMQGSPSGGGPYTHPFTLDPTVDPKSYTIDILKGQVVERYFGAEIESLEPSFNKNKMELKAKFSALGSFIVREVASVSVFGGGVTTITLKTNYDPVPTTGLVATDLLRCQPANGGVAIDTTITSLGNATIVVGSDVSSLVAGDLIFLRAQTPSYTLRQPFLWALTQFCFGATATAALSAAQTRVEQGSKWVITNKFENAAGADRSGSFDPAALVRTQADGTLDVKLFFDTLDDFNRFLTVSKRACVIRHYSEGNQYELRITLNNIVAKDAPVPLKSGSIVYADFKFQVFYDSSDAQGMDVKVLNALATV